jgi:GNAT superfamily N-acetyltransferase
MADYFRAPATDEEWRAYHAIRRHVLFERRGRAAAYDARHPDEHRAGNHPHVFWHDGEAVGAIRVDVDGQAAIFRLVAIREDRQRQGLGRRMLEHAERFASSSGCVRVDSHVFVGAVGFYERCGFRCVEEQTPTAQTVLMSKSLPT